MSSFTLVLMLSCLCSVVFVQLKPFYICISIIVNASFAVTENKQRKLICKPDQKLGGANELDLKLK